MTALKPKPYSRSLHYTYSLGIFPTMELLDAAPDKLMYLIVSSRSQSNPIVQRLNTTCRDADIPIYVNDKWLDRLSPKENCYVVGVFRKYVDSISPEHHHIVLVNPSNMGNLGTILRTALGFGIQDIALIRPAADIFDPKVVRASMGAIFRIRFSYFDHIAAYLHDFDDRPIYSFMSDGKQSLPATAVQQIPGPFTLVFGNESTGLDDKYHEVGTSVCIPHEPSIDSLNLAIAVGIGCYAFSATSRIRRNLEE